MQGDKGVWADTGIGSSMHGVVETKTSSIEFHNLNGLGTAKSCLCSLI